MVILTPDSSLFQPLSSSLYYTFLSHTLVFFVFFGDPLSLTKAFCVTTALELLIETLWVCWVWVGALTQLKTVTVSLHTLSVTN